MHPKIPISPHSFLIFLVVLLGLSCTPPVVPEADTTEAQPDTTEQGPPDNTPTTTADPLSTTDGTLTSLDSTTTAATTTASTGLASETTLGSTGEGTTSDTSLCGNFFVDDGEECDLGPMHNWDHGACTSQCMSAKCGDGLLFEGVEACDEGEQNGPGYNQCSSCQFGPRCGDGVLTPEFEECDGGGPDGGGEIEGIDTNCQAGCTWDGRIIFISSTKFAANLGGLTGADLQCQNLAKAANLSGFAGYRVWLSDADESPLDRLEFGPERLVLLSGVQIAENLDALLANGPDDGISVTELHTTLMNAPVWTNTAVTGEVFSDTDHCKNWTSTASKNPDDSPAEASTGLNAVLKLPADVWDAWSDGRWWTHYLFPQNCSNTAHLYCIEDATP